MLISHATMAPPIALQVRHAAMSQVAIKWIAVPFPMQHAVQQERHAVLMVICALRTVKVAVNNGTCITNINYMPITKYECISLSKFGGIRRS